MECTGTLHGIQKDWQTDNFIISIAVNENISQEMVEEIQNCKLSVILKKFRKKRSLDANAYCWALVTKIAEAVKSSKEEVYEEMLQKYGHIYEDEGGYITITLKVGIDPVKVGGHWKYIKDNGKFASYLMIKGSSEYDTKEMSYFLDCIVQEAKEIGIETMPPAEIERMLSSWQKA